MGLFTQTARWVKPWGGRGGCVRLVSRACPDRWIEYRPKLAVWDAVVADHCGSMAVRMAAAKTLRTPDLFAAIGFIENSLKR